MTLKPRSLFTGKFSFLFLFLMLTISCQPAKVEKWKQLTTQGIQLHYNIEGQGDTIIFVHGSLVDLRYWKEQIPVLSKQYTLITYSRRYNYPNVNDVTPDHSALVEASDLFGLMNELKIRKANILGHSYGAYTSLLFAIAHPDGINKLILAEPPLFRWLPDLPNGAGRMEKFMDEVWIPIGKAYLEKGDEGGLDVTSRWGFNAPLDSIPQEWRDFCLKNSKEWRALAMSSDAYPRIDSSAVKNMNIPTLLLSGALNAGKVNDIIDTRLSQLLPNNRRVIIANSGHEVFVDNPKATNQAILDFLRK